jgi:drug/metabolite transporter (DMT)-like permease
VTRTELETPKVNDGSNEPKPLGRGLAAVFVFGGALVVASLVDLVRYLFDWHAPMTTSWLLAISFTGFAVGGIAFVSIAKARKRRGPTPNNRWRGP